MVVHTQKIGVEREFYISISFVCGYNLLTAYGTPIWCLTKCYRCYVIYDILNATAGANIANKH